MPPQYTPTELNHAVLQFIESGTYPEGEALASAELPLGALRAVLHELGDARERVQVCFLLISLPRTLIDDRQKLGNSVAVLPLT